MSNDAPSLRESPERAPFPGRESVAADALRLWGEAAQLDMMIEECAEFIQAVQHYKRGRVTAEAVASEIADVRLMMDQAAWMFGPDLCADLHRQKLVRLTARIDVAEARRHESARKDGASLQDQEPHDAR